MIKKFLLTVLMVSSFNMYADSKVGSTRLSKKDKQDLVEMFTEFIDGMERSSDAPIKEQINSRWWFWETPMARIERSIDQLNQMAQQIQNYIVELNVAQQDDHGAKECCKEALKRLEQLELLLAKLIALLIEERGVLGSLDDESVGEQEFNSVADIDNAELSIISWLKTIYREQLKDKFIS
jgi:hypothetical protein